MVVNFNGVYLMILIVYSLAFISSISDQITAIQILTFLFNPLAL